MEKKFFGVMIDCSRNGVMKVDRVKKFAEIISSFGYNMLQLYTEDTIKVDGEPYFGHLRGGYTKEEIKELVKYCKEVNVELVPCIQTLAHLNQIFYWPAYEKIHDAIDILMVGEERTYKLIENIFKILRECYTTNYVNIGMDEATMLGLGKYLTKNGYQDRFSILLKHLKKVCEIAKKYNFKPIMWSDTFMRISNGDSFNYEDNVVPNSVKELVPENIGLIYWDYYNTEFEHFDKAIKIHKEFNRELWFAGGAWSWVGFAPRNTYTLMSMKPAISACRENGVENVFMTMWGDDGRECSVFALLPALYAIRRFYDGETDEEKIKKEFNIKTGEDYSAFFNLDLPNLIGQDIKIDTNVCKYALFSDPFNGVLDTTILKGASEKYKKMVPILKKYSKKGEYAYLFDVEAKLCSVLSLKAELGSKQRKAYQENDREELTRILGDYNKILYRLNVFYKSFKKAWLLDNKPGGYDVHDLRFGGLKQRLISCRERLKDYLDGKTKEILELSEKELCFFEGEEPFKTPVVCNWIVSASPNKI